MPGQRSGPGGSRLAGRRIVVGVDGSPPSMRALAWGAAEAELRGAVLEVVHARFYRRQILETLAPGILSDERSVLDQALARAKALAPNVSLEARMCDPPAAQALIKESEGAELLVVGSRGLNHLNELSLGSVSSECAHHARCPVVIIPLPARQPKTPPRRATVSYSNPA